jgi:hypothetical protein
MGSTTHWVRQALAELGPTASVSEITAFIIERDSTVAKAHISLAVRKVKAAGIAAHRHTRPAPSPPPSKERGLFG